MLGRQVRRLVSGVVIAAISMCCTALPPVSTPASLPTSVPASAVSPTVSTITTPASPVNAVQATPDAQIWNLKNADIRAVIQTISILTGKNFIIDPRVNGTVNLISQKPMTPDEMYQVFLSMLQTLQFSAVPSSSGDVIKIVPSMDANVLSQQIATRANPGTGDEVVVRVVPVSHVSATELVPVLRPLMTQWGSVTAYVPSNTLILAGGAANVNRLVEMISTMDSANQTQIVVVHLRYANAKKLVDVIQRLQSGGLARGETGTATLAAYEEDNSILVDANMVNQLLMRRLIRQLDQAGSQGDNTRVVQLNYLSAKKLAPILAKIAGGIAQAPSAQGEPDAVAADMSGGGKSGVSIEAEVSDNAIIIHAPKSMLMSLMQVIRRLDVRPTEVLVEAIIVKVDEDLLNQLGIIWGASNNAATATTPTSPDTTASISKNNRATVQFTSSGGIGFLPGENLTALLHLLKSNGSSDVLSTPSIVVLNNNKASILDGKNIAEANRVYQSNNSTTSSGSNSTDSSLVPFTNVQRTDVGLSLDVTPHISPNHMIRMELLQKDESVVADANAGSNNPNINTSKIQTSVMVRSGDILVLGGLVQNQQIKTHQKLPILGDIPGLGKLFRYDTSKLRKTNLMVFIRPIIMSQKSAHQQTMDRYAYVRDQQVKIQTDRVTERPMPLLPPLRHDLVPLPAPVSNKALPVPTTTLTSGTVH